MRAIRFHGPGDLRLESLPDPAADASTITIAVDACGVCGSDIHFVDGSARTGYMPITLGHEVAGRVVASEDPSWAEGDAVIVEVGMSCGVCPRCAEGRPNLCGRAQIVGIDFDGGLADLMAVPVSLAVRRPPNLSPEVAATAVDAGATALHAVRRRAEVRQGDAVLVIGAGGLGLYGIQFARQAGAAPIIVADTDAAALERAHAVGADEVVHVEPGMSVGRTVKLLTDGGADVALEFVGKASSVDAAIKSIRPGGRAVVVGVGTEPITTLPSVLWSNNEYTLTGSYGSLPGDTAAVLDALTEGSIVPPPIETVALEDAAAAILGVAEGNARPGGRMVVVP